LPKLPPARVLIVDDGEANRQLITVILTRAGLQVESAENGEVAVRMATSRHFDLILMDMQMPVMDGYTATTKLRQQGLSIPIVALTASVMKGTENKCGDVGCSAYVAKPVDFDELMCCLAELLKGVAGASQEPDQGVGSSPRSEIPPPSEAADGKSLAAAAWAAKADGESGLNPADFVRFVKEQLNAMYSALQQGHFATLAQLAGSVRETADVSARGEFHAVATRLEKLAEQQAIAEIEDSICELAILSESIALRSHKSDEQPSAPARGATEKTVPSTPAPLPPPRDAPWRRPPLLSSLPMDDPDFRQIVEGFIQRLREQAVAMQAAWEQRDLAELARLSHWLKGAGGTVGFEALTEPAKKLELLAKQGRVAEIDGALGEVLDMIDSAAIPLVV
jgi:CheY-like chemotaxis protein